MADEELVTPEVPPAPPPDPSAFTPGSFTPATEALSLKDRLRASSSSATDKVSAEIQGIKRGRGRPPGSKNRPKEPAGDKPTAPTGAELLKERETKKKRSDQIAGQITGELNEALMKFLISQGAPPALLYNEGHMPVSINKMAGKYTEVGTKLAVDDFTASMVAAFVVEVEDSDIGGQMVAKATGGPVALVVKGLVAGACVVGYLNGVRQVMKQIEPVAQAYREYQRQQNRQNKDGNQ